MLTSKCKSCSSDCCKYLIPLSAEDCIRISTKLDLTIEDFFLLCVDSKGRLKVKLVEGSEYCMFIDPNNLYLGCTIHEFKPSICSRYACIVEKV